MPGISSARQRFIRLHIQISESLRPSWPTWWTPFQKPKQNNNNKINIQIKWKKLGCKDFIICNSLWLKFKQKAKLQKSKARESLPRSRCGWEQTDCRETKEVGGAIRMLDNTSWDHLNHYKHLSKLRLCPTARAYNCMTFIAQESFWSQSSFGKHWTPVSGSPWGKKVVNKHRLFSWEIQST